MNFASWTFIGLFLPAVLCGVWLVRGEARRRDFLTLASLLFYAVTGWLNAGVLAASLAVNFAAGHWLSRAPRARKGPRLAVTVAAVAFNVILLLGFKIAALGGGMDQGFSVNPDLLLPLGLSFVTFHQIGFVVACHRGQIAALDLRNYLFFIAFFPQLLMGPILQYQQIDGQLRGGALRTQPWESVAVGLAIFLFGLSKKVLLGDALFAPVDGIFAAAGKPQGVSPAVAWFGAAGAVMQIYMDFSGYADMAVGLARMVNVNVPLNFDRSLRVTGRFEHWRNWHISLTVFLRTHVFLPLVRHAGFSPLAAIAATAAVSALWHGLGWTFVIWGAFQIWLLVWAHYTARWFGRGPLGPWRRRAAIARTFAVTCCATTMFRAPDLASMGGMLSAMAGGTFGAATQDPSVELGAVAVLLLAAALAFWFPDPRDFFGRFWTAIDPRHDAAHRAKDERPAWIQFQLTPTWAIVFAALAVVCLYNLGTVQRFVYVQF
jgi:alginate O-acetyltransferase complex protein AlgI